MDTTVWLKGIAAAIIGGAATAGSSWAAINLAASAGAIVPTLNFKALGIIMLAGAVTNFLAFLKQSPIPTTIERTERTTITKEVTATPTPEDVHENPN